MSILAFKQASVIDNLKTGENARAVRLKADFSIEGVAHKMGVSKAFLSYLETGQRGWSELLAENFEKAVAK